MKACIELFSPLFAPGGWMALGGERQDHNRVHLLDRKS